MLGRADKEADGGDGGEIVMICRPCPKCNREESVLLATTNEWRYYCPDCDIRFNQYGVVL